MKAKYLTIEKNNKIKKQKCWEWELGIACQSLEKEGWKIKEIKDN